MKDKYGREIHYLRISLTDRCNLRCQYCMPEEGVVPVAHEEILRYREIERLVHIMAGMGVSRVRLTGGEPLVRKNVEDLACMIKSVPGITFLGVTTNGSLLSEKANILQQAGVDGLNISLDTTDPNRYRILTRRDAFHAVWDGLQMALSLPFKSVKINCVLSPYSVPSDWLGVVALAQKMPVDVRLIEWMPMAGEKMVSAIQESQAMKIISEKFGTPKPVPSAGDAGPAQYWHIEGFRGKIGIIHAMSNCFCATCNRVRLTATGDLRLCLFYDQGIALKPLLRGSSSDTEIREAISTAIAHKPERHHGHRQSTDEEIPSPIDSPCCMNKIGG